MAAATAPLPSELNPHRLQRRGRRAARVGAVVGSSWRSRPGSASCARRCRGRRRGWLALAVALEALSCVSYVLLFRPVFCRRMPWVRSWQIGMSELAVGSLVPASGASGLALGAWVLRQGGMAADRIARRSVAFFLIKSSVNFVAVAVLGLLLATGLLGPELSLWLTALPAGMALVVIATVLLVPRLGPGADPAPDAGRLRRGTSSARRALIQGTAEAIELVRSRDWMILVGAVGYWAFDNAVLWATFNAFGESPALTIILLGYLIGQLGGLLPLPGGIGGIDGGLIGTLIVFGAPVAATAAAVLAYRVILFWLPLLVGGPAFASLRRTMAQPGGRAALATAELLTAAGAGSPVPSDPSGCMPPSMSVDKLQDAEEDVAQLREEQARSERDARAADLRRPPVADTAGKPHRTITAALGAVRPMANMRTGPLADIHELAVSIRETGLLHPPLVRATGEDDQPYELLAGQRRFAAMALVDEAEGAREDWRFTVVDGISRREALTMQFAENFHQSKPEPVQFARAARRIMAEDPSLTAAEVSRLVGAPAAWTRKALRLLELPDAIVDRVEAGDLSFTNADLVRRGIARGDVSADEASELVEQHAGGDLSGAELKHGVGYVPPPPATTTSSRAAWTRRASARPATPTIATTTPSSATGSPRPTRRGPCASSGATRARRRSACARPTSTATCSGMVLFSAAGDHRRSVLRVTSLQDAHQYAFSLRPAERLTALRSLAAEVLATDPDPPHALRDVAGVGR
jgi:uncharacterized protein (TIRG00374 family)